jgi:hypothetical protein
MRLCKCKGGRSAPPCEHEIEKIKLTPLETECLEERWPTSGEKPCFLFLEGSTGAEDTADAATVAPPDASATHADTSAVCVASSVDRPAAGASAPAPGACSPAASAALGEGAQDPTSQEGPVLRRFPPPHLPPTTSTPMSPGEKVPAARAARTLRLSALGAPSAGSPAPSSAPPLLFPPLRRARARARGVSGSDRAAFTATLH